MKPFFPVLALVLSITAGACAQSFIPTPPPAKDGSKLGFDKPYEYERQAYGYDPDGVQYKENQVEDFQVIFITSAPFAALASLGLTGLASTLIEGRFDVGGPYLVPFIAGTVVGAGTVACVSVLSNQYPPPDEEPVLSCGPARQRLAFALPLLNARF